MIEKEEYVYVLDYLPEGKYTDYKRSPLVQGLGTKNFTLLALEPKEGVQFEALEKVFVGKGDRDKIALVKGTISEKDLTGNAQSVLKNAVSQVIEDDEEKFLNFYNKSGSVSMRLHQLELLPGIGKKHFLELMEERQKKPFASFEDIKKRIKLFPDPKQILVERILSELRGDEKYYLFARPPKRPRPF